MPSSAPSPAAAPPSVASLDGALLELCERVDVAPGGMRVALVEFLRRAEAAGLSVPAIRAALEPRAGVPPVRPTRRSTGRDLP